MMRQKMNARRIYKGSRGSDEIRRALTSSSVDAGQHLGIGEGVLVGSTIRKTIMLPIDMSRDMRGAQILGRVK